MMIIGKIFPEKYNYISLLLSVNCCFIRIRLWSFRFLVVLFLLGLNGVNYFNLFTSVITSWCFYMYFSSCQYISFFLFLDFFRLIVLRFQFIISSSVGWLKFLMNWQEMKNWDSSILNILVYINSWLFLKIGDSFFVVFLLCFSNVSIFDSFVFRFKCSYLVCLVFDLILLLFVMMFALILLYLVSITPKARQLNFYN